MANRGSQLHVHVLMKSRFTRMKLVSHFTFYFHGKKIRPFMNHENTLEDNWSMFQTKRRASCKKGVYRFFSRFSFSAGSS